ncbi:MAG: HDIG domain-containing metalloprotein [Ilumatobacteraceae bacterium]
MTARSAAAHLVRRWLGALSRREPEPHDLATVREVLSSSELALWSRLRVEDRRHSIEVLRRFDQRVASATRAARAGALLHDIGKVDSDLGITARVVATVVGPRGERFATYHRHEEIGMAMLRSVGSDAETIELVGGRGAHAAALAAADEI